MTQRFNARAFAAAPCASLYKSVSLPALIAACVGLALPASVSAQERELEDVIIVSAPLDHSRLESLQGVEVLDRDDIVEHLSGGLGDTLDSQPGVSSTFFGAGASRPIIRGLGGDRVRVLENGIGAIDASTASPDHAVTADGLDAERIEILRGSAALAYGGNAIGGVINVIDESIPTRAVDGISLEGLAAYSTVDNGTQGAANVAMGAGALNFRFSAASRETDNYDTPEGEAPNSWTDFQAYAGGASLVRDWGFAGLAVKHTQDNYGLYPEAPGEPGGHIELEQTRIEARGDVRVDLGIFDRLDFAAQQSDYEHTEFEGNGEAGTRFLSDGWEGRVEAHHGSGNLQGAIGLQYSDVDFSAEGDEAFITATNTRDTGVFALERWDTGVWGLEGGARIERREIVNQGGGTREFDNLSLSGGAFFRPTENWFLGATIARTERAPTQIELFADGPHLATDNYEIGDPTLDQETALSFEASARYDSGRFQFEASLFHIAFDNYIALVETGEVWWSDEDTGTNGFASDETDPSIPLGAGSIAVVNFLQRDASFTGGEVSVRSELFEAGGFTFSGEAALDLVQAEFDGGAHPPRIPPRTARLAFEGESDRWTGRVELVDTASQDRIAAFETTTPGYSFVNAGLAFRPFGREGNLTLRIDGRNLTDELGRVHTSFLKEEMPLPGRNLRFTVMTSF
jgi:iron complex outermembrane receptor protein